MQRMFQSATLKLTLWYLAIIMAISITFSIVIYQLNYREVNNRLENLQHSIISGFSSEDIFRLTLPLNNYAVDGPGSYLFNESRKASDQMITSLIYINLVLLLAGGLGSFLLARRTLRPIAEAHEAQSRFTSDASHELRTPLAAMKTELEVSLRDPRLEIGEARELLESNLEEVNKLISLSEMLLQLSRFENGKLDVEKVDLTILLHEAIDSISLDKKRFDITSRKKAVTCGNKVAINQLISILLENSAKYSPPGSTIYIKIFQQRGMLGFEIKNSGEKIPKELTSKLFDRFFRIDTSRTDGSKNGYGLGLSIAKKIVTLHGGEIFASSTDDFTTFTFLIPVVKSR